MLYLAWRQRFGKASPRTDLTNRRQEATKPFFKEIPPRKLPPETCSGISSIAQRIPPRLASGPLFNNLQEAQSPATRTPINKLPCIPHKSMPSESPRCIRHRSALHQPSQRAAQAHAAHCLSRSGKMGTDKKHIISPPALHCHAPHPHPDRKRSVPRPPCHAFTPYKDRRTTSRLTSHHKKKQSFT